MRYTIQDLRDAIEGLPDDMPIAVAYQPNYPLRARIVNARTVRDTSHLPPCPDEGTCPRCKQSGVEFDCDPDDATAPIVCEECGGESDIDEVLLVNAIDIPPRQDGAEDTFWIAIDQVGSMSNENPYDVPKAAWEEE